MSDSSTPYWSLAAGCIPDVLPWNIPRVAHSAGFATCGMWIDTERTWDSDALSKTRQALSETGVTLIDVEALWLAGTSSATDSHKIAIDAGLELGARNVLVVSVHEDYAASIAQFRDLCEQAGSDIRINLEFGQFTKLRSLAAAREFIRAVDHPSAGILIDLMHLNRSGEPLPNLQDQLFSYIQACDFWQASASLSGDAYIEAAVDFRCVLGAGEAARSDFRTVCESSKDVSLEIRSKALRDEYPDPVERAKHILNHCRRNAWMS